MTFGEFIREKRQEKGINLRKLAELTEIAPGYLSDIEQGKRNPPQQEKLDKIIEVLQLSSEDIINVNDMIAQARTNTVAPDISEYISSNDVVRVALRKAQELQLSDTEWLRIIQNMTQEHTEGT